MALDGVNMRDSYLKVGGGVVGLQQGTHRCLQAGFQGWAGWFSGLPPRRAPQAGQLLQGGTDQRGVKCQGTHADTADMWVVLGLSLVMWAGRGPQYWVAVLKTGLR